MKTQKISSFKQVFFWCALVVLTAQNSQASDNGNSQGFWSKLKHFFSNNAPQDDDSSNPPDPSDAEKAAAQPTPSPSNSNDFCSVNGIEKLWAQKRLAADEMLSYIDSHHLRSPTVATRVYVLDTGFDTSHLKDLSRPDGLKLAQGVFGTQVQHGEKTIPTPGNPTTLNGDASQISLVGDPSNDAGGHGTMVVSTIAAKDGMGVAPHADVTLMRITASDAPEASGSTPDSFLLYAISHACLVGRAENPDGVILINKSWVTRADEQGTSTLETDHPEIVKILRDNGCLLIEAAGNDSFRSNSSSDDLSAPILSVGATGPFDNFSDFSSSGGLLAPGENVYVLESMKTTEPAYNFQRCNASEDLASGSPRRLINGTSFASPFAAGIASEALGVLESLHNSELAALDPASRALLLGRILKASSEFGVVHGLRAVMIAERWSGGLMSSNDLKNLITTPVPALCSDNTVNPQVRFAACDSQKQFSSAIALQKNQLNQGYFQTAAGYLRAAEMLASDKDDIDTPVDDFMNRFLVQKYGTSDPNQLSSPLSQVQLRVGLDAGMTPFVIKPYIEKMGAQSLPVLKALLESYSVTDYLRRGPGRGSEEILAALLDAIQQFDAKAGSAATLSLLNEVIDFQLSNLDKKTYSQFANAEQLSTTVRIIDGLSGQADLQSAFTDAKPKIISALDSYPMWFGESTQTSVNISEIYENRPYIFDFFSKNPDLVSSILQRPDFNSTSLVDIQYLLEKEAPADTNFYLKAILAIDKNSNWASQIQASEFRNDLAKSLLSFFSTLSSDARATFLAELLAMNGAGPNAWAILDNLGSSITQTLLQAMRAGRNFPAVLPDLDLVELIANNENALSSLPKTGLTRWYIRDIQIELIGVDNDPRATALNQVLKPWN